MGVRRLEGIPGFNIDRVAAAAGDDPDVLRMDLADSGVKYLSTDLWSELE